MRLIVACSGVAFGQSIGFPIAKIVCITGVSLHLTYSTSVKKSLSHHRLIAESTGFAHPSMARI
jgi:hypothetical protein